MFVAKAYSIEYLAFQDAPDGEFSDEIICAKPQNVWSWVIETKYFNAKTATVDILYSLTQFCLHGV